MFDDQGVDNFKGQVRMAESRGKLTILEDKQKSGILKNR